MAFLKNEDIKATACPVLFGGKRLKKICATCPDPSVSVGNKIVVLSVVNAPSRFSAYLSRNFTHNMEQAEFLAKNVFTDLKNLNDGFDQKENLHFNEWDFAIVLDRAEYFGIAIYEIQAWLEGALHDTAHHEPVRKKATDSAWYKKALMTFSTRQPGLTFSASYRVSPKLLTRQVKGE